MAPLGRRHNTRRKMCSEKNKATLYPALKTTKSSRKTSSEKSKATLYPAFKPAGESTESSRMDNRESPEALILRLAADSGSCVLIQVTNNSQLSLESKRYYCKSGEVLYHGLGTIEPGAEDCTLFVKKSFTACGSVGALTFQINDRQSQRLAILFSNPYNNTIYDRTFALHFSKNGASAKQLYEDMYYHGERLENYTKAQKDSVIQMPHKLIHNGIQVTASMSGGSKSILRVDIEDRPAAGNDRSGKDRSGKDRSGKDRSGNTSPSRHSIHVKQKWKYCHEFKM